MSIKDYIIKKIIKLNDIESNNNNFSFIESIIPKYQDDIELIIPYFYPDKAVKDISKQHKFGIIVDNEYLTSRNIESLKLLNKDTNILFINITDNLETIIDNMLICEKIMSANLIYIKIANSFGIPSIYYSNKTLNNDDVNKFNNYIKTISSNSRIYNSTLKLDKIDTQFIINPQIEDLQKELYNKILLEIRSKININNLIYSPLTTNEIIKSTLSSKKNFFINRLGGLDFDLYSNFKINNSQINKVNKDIIQNLNKYAGYYDVNNKSETILQFIKKYEESYKNSDIIFAAGSDLCSSMKFMLPTSPYYSSQSNLFNFAKPLISDKVCLNYHDYLESFKYLHEWFPLFDSKRILIISPFKKEIREQLKIKEKLFAENKLFKKFKYPRFADIEYINTPLTLNNFELPHKNWVETFEYICSKINGMINKFDIAFLMCGCYASPLGSYIKSKGKSAIYLGGIGQLLFGIKGNRYDIEYFNQFMNKHWIYPYLRNKIVVKDNYQNFEGLKAYF